MEFYTIEQCFTNYCNGYLEEAGSIVDYIKGLSDVYPSVLGRGNFKTTFLGTRLIRKGAVEQIQDNFNGKLRELRSDLGRDIQKVTCVTISVLPKETGLLCLGAPTDVIGALPEHQRVIVSLIGEYLSLINAEYLDRVEAVSSMTMLESEFIAESDSIAVYNDFERDVRDLYLGFLVDCSEIG